MLFGGTVPRSKLVEVLTECDLKLSITRIESSSGQILLLKNVIGVSCPKGFLTKIIQIETGNSESPRALPEVTHCTAATNCNGVKVSDDYTTLTAGRHFD